MRALIFLFFSLLLISGCRSYLEDYHVLYGETIQPSNLNCTGFIREINEKWAIYNTKLKEGHCYLYNKKLIETILENKKCFIGLKEDDLIKLLGEPSQVSGHNCFYLLSKNCTNEYDYINDEYYHLRFTILDTIGAVDFYPIVTDY